MGKMILNGKEYAGSGVITLPECVCKRTGFAGTTHFYEALQELNAIPGSGAFSVEAYFWIYDDSDGYILSFGAGSTHAVLGMGAKSIVTWGDDWSLSGSHTGLHHRVIVYDGNLTMKTYEDNVLINTKTFSSGLNISSGNFYWGCWIQNNYGVRGNVHYAKYYNKALTSDEVSLLYANRNNQF